MYDASSCGAAPLERVLSGASPSCQGRVALARRLLPSRKGVTMTGYGQGGKAGADVPPHPPWELPASGNAGTDFPPASDPGKFRMTEGPWRLFAGIRV